MCSSIFHCQRRRAISLSWTGATIRWKRSTSPEFGTSEELFNQVVSGDGAIFKTFAEKEYEHYRLYLENLPAAW